MRRPRSSIANAKTKPTARVSSPPPTRTAYHRDVRWLVVVTLLGCGGSSSKPDAGMTGPDADLVCTPSGSPQCDPLTLETICADGSRKQNACGATQLPAEIGCISPTASPRTFVCAGLPPASRTITDRAPTNGLEFTSCAAGYIPLLRAATGSQVIVCAGICSPKKTDMTMPTNAQGDIDALAKPHDEVAPAAGKAICAPGARGSEANEDCLYMWLASRVGGVLMPSPYNDTTGFCFAPSHYSYDHDKNPNTPARAVPLCEQLPPKGTVANCTCDANGNACTGTGCPDGQAHEWGCYPSTDSNLATLAPKLDLQIAAPRPASSTRHRIVQ